MPIKFPFFRLPNRIIVDIVNGKIDYNSVEGDSENEISKGFYFENQARVNLNLVGNFAPFCSALEAECGREKCRLYKKGSAGKIADAWVCREHCLDFLDAPFDSRWHVPFVGTEKLDKKETIANLRNLVKEGAKYACLGCGKLYQKKRTEPYEDGHGGRRLEMCACGSDLFEDAQNFIKRIS